ncbi:MFS transporter [Kitasatospora sp. NPDC057965]|uniref:MFS transporter n=1 Tax=Kitasatospora sp. NPDC057965 TaxID=3346291 RepID=UPI0036DACFD7
MTGTPRTTQRGTRQDRVPRRHYPGWHMVWALAATETVSFGAMYYSFAVLLVPMQQDLGHSATQLTGAFSVSLLVTGAAAVPVGAWLDRHGARALMTCGSLLGAAALAAWSRAESLPSLYTAFVLLGIAGAATQYEPAFATVNAYFETQRRDALLTLTVVAGFASTIFMPLTTFLTDYFGWRTALLLLALLQAATALPHAWLLRRSPADHGWQRDGTRTAEPAVETVRPPADDAPRAPGTPDGLLAALRSRPVVLLTAGALLGTLAVATISVHLVSYLREHHYTPATAAIAAGALGAMQVAGRIALTMTARRVRLAVVTATMISGQVLAVTALLAIPGTTGLVVFVLFFGSAFGVLHIARADLLADYAPRRYFARLSGIQALLLVTAEAAAPTGAAALRTAAGTYTPVLITVATICAAAAVLLFGADHAHRSRTPRASAPVGRGEKAGHRAA